MKAVKCILAKSPPYEFRSIDQGGLWEKGNLISLATINPQGRKGVTLLATFNFEVIKTVAVLAEGSKGWRKELNLVSWNGREPKYDIRDWSEDHTKMGKGITFSKEELEILKSALDTLPELE